MLRRCGRGAANSLEQIIISPPSHAATRLVLLVRFYVQQKYQGEFNALQKYLNDTDMPLARAFSLRKGAKGSDKRVKLNCPF